MQFQSDKQRRAVFARMPKVHGFALRGRGGTARRNRALLAGAGVLGAGTAAVLLRSHAPDALAALVRPVGYMRNLRPPAGLKKVVAFSTMRPPETGLERFMVNAPLIGRAFGRKGELYGTPLTTRLTTSILRGRGGLHPRPGLAGRAANVVDRASLWNIMGKGNLLGMLEDSRVIAKDAAARSVAHGRQWLIAPQRVASKKLRGRLTAMQQIKRRYQPEELAKAASIAQGTKTERKVVLRVQRADIRLGRVKRKTGKLLGLRTTKPSRLETQLRRPLVVFSQRLRRTDRKINRWVRKQARRVGIEA